MNLYRIKKNHSQTLILLADHVPNLAMRNEFQTNTFKLRINKLEMIEEECQGYRVDQGGIFLLVSVTLTNCSNEILSFSKNELLVSYDKEEPYEPEDYFEVENQFEDEIALKPNEEVKGKYVYIVASNAKRIAIRYIENYEDDRFKEYRLRYSIPQ